MLTHINDFVLLCIVCVAAITDVQMSKVPNRLILVGLFSGLILKICSGGLSGLWTWLPGIIVTGVVAYVLWFIGTFGAGDAKLLTIIGGMTDMQTGIGISVISLFVGVVAGICIFVRYRHRKRHLICFAPMIAVATGSVLIFQNVL